MNRKLIGLMLVGALALGGACGKKDKENTKEPPKPAAKTTEAPKPPPAKDLTAEERVTFFNGCWAAFNGKDKAKFEQCYTENVTMEMADSGQPAAEGRDALMEQIDMFWKAYPDGKGTPQIVLVSGNRIIAVELFQGTNTGEYMGMPATNKKIGYHFLHDFVSTGPGPVEKETIYADMATEMGQLGVNPAPHRPVVEQAGETIVAIAADDDKEKANLEVAQKACDAFGAHDVKALVELYADDAVARDLTMPADIVGKKDMTKTLNSIFKAFPDLKCDTHEKIAAGDYVAAFSTMSGTNKGPMKEMGLKKATNKSIELHGGEVMKIVDGKITEHWMFMNGMAFAIQLGLMPDPAAAAGGAEEGGGDEGGEE